MQSPIVRSRVQVLLVLALFLTGCESRPAGRHRPVSPTRDTPDEASALESRQAIDAETPPPPVVFVEFVSTPQDVVDRMLRLARVSRGDTVYDLGCGDGRIVVTAARKYGCRAFGCDLDPLRVSEARTNAENSGVAHLVTVEQRDLFSVDLSEATVVALYLGSRLNARLLPQLKRLKPGARIVSHDYAIEGIDPDKVVTMTSRQDRRKHTIYLWTSPLRETR